MDRKVIQRREDLFGPIFGINRTRSMSPYSILLPKFLDSFLYRLVYRTYRISQVLFLVLKMTTCFQNSNFNESKFGAKLEIFYVFYTPIDKEKIFNRKNIWMVVLSKQYRNNLQKKVIQRREIFKPIGWLGKNSKVKVSLNMSF